MNAHGHYQCNSMPSADTMSTFSALHLLRSYNNLLLPSDNHRYQQLVNSNDFLLGRAVSSGGVTTASPVAVDVGATMAPFGSLPSAAFIASHGLLAAGYHPNLYASSEAKTSPVLHRSLSANSCASGSGCTGGNSKRQRGEKKPIPEDQKDEKYFERRKRNNQAAKKSRDARKIREDQIALRATMLEHENAILRAQILTLREEASSLRQMLLLKKTTEQSTTDLQMCRQP